MVRGKCWGTQGVGEYDIEKRTQHLRQICLIDRQIEMDPCAIWWLSLGISGQAVQRLSSQQMWGQLVWSRLMRRPCFSSGLGLWLMIWNRGALYPTRLGCWRWRPAGRHSSSVLMLTHCPDRLASWYSARETKFSLQIQTLWKAEFFFFFCSGVSELGRAGVDICLWHVT